LADIGGRLVEARREAGLTQRELAERLGLRQQQVARWERERYGCVSLARLSRVADALGVTWDDPAGPLAAEAGATYGGDSGTGVATTELAVRPVRDLGEVVARIRAHAPELHERFGVTHVAVFGSFARGEQRPDSDVDLIVEVEHPSLENVFGAEEVLRSILGRKVDTGSFDALRRRVQPFVAKEAVDVWRA
jgi:hypothetical protein